MTLVLVGATLGLLMTRGNAVTLSLDGNAKTIHTDGHTVGQVLQDEGIALRAHDVVAPGLDSVVHDGTRIAVRFGRPLMLNLDGDHSKHWVTATDVGDALRQIGLRFGDANLSTSRGAEISRSGMRLTIATPKHVTFAVGAAKPVTRTVAALTVGQALRMKGFHVDANDLVKPGRGKILDKRTRITVTKVRVVRRHVDNETLPYGTVKSYDSSMYEGNNKVTRAGRNGQRDVTYRLRFENGRLVGRKVLSVSHYVAPVSERLLVGTKKKPVVSSYSTGSTVWDSIAQCESGGNWAANTGNGYYGGLQFSLGTWQAYGGSGLPSENSRETQIAIAEKVRAAEGGYSAWPVCGSRF